MFGSGNEAGYDYLYVSGNDKYVTCYEETVFLLVLQFPWFPLVFPIDTKKGIKP